MKKKVVLDNGLCVISDCNEHVSTVVYAVYFAVGSLYESKRYQGISHLVEHMFFRRLNKLCQKELYFSMESMGGTIRGFTSKQYVCFEFAVVSNYASEAFGLMKEFLSDFCWTQEELDAERNVVCRQIELLGDNINYLDYYQMGIGKYSVPIKGTIKTINELTLSDVNQWKKSFFTCNNACFVATGNLSSELEDDLIVELSRLNPTNNKVKRQMVCLPKAFSRSKEDCLFPNIPGNIADVSIFFDIDLLKDDWIASQVVFDAFCCGNGSKLSLCLKDTYALTDDLDSELSAFGHYGRLCISWSVNDKSLFRSLDVFFDQLEIFRQGITEDEYISSIVFSTSNAIIFRDSPLKLSFQYGYYDFICNIPFSIEESVNRKNILTISEINNTAQSILIPENMFVYVAANRNHIRKNELVKYFFH